VHERIGGGNDNESTVPVQETTNSIIVTNTSNQNISTNKRQSDSNDLDDSEQPRIIKTTPGSQRTAIGTSSTTTSGLGQNVLSLFLD
jgi:hypothetical protein